MGQTMKLQQEELVLMKSELETLRAAVYDEKKCTDDVAALRREVKEYQVELLHIVTATVMLVYLCGELTVTRRLESFWPSGLGDRRRTVTD